MSGVELAGLVLGSFPILLNCLDYYREGFEPLEEWWNFRTHFITFVDDIRHQMMRYNENIIRLLDPIVTDNEGLMTLVRQPDDPRWKDGSLELPLDRRLASERDRFFRIVDRMHGVMEELEKLLQISGGQVSWTGSAQHRPWEWHLTRVRLSFSKGKHRKVKKLAAHNQELQEILGYSERIIPIADRRKSSEPVAVFEKIRQHACCISTTLRQHWRCNMGKCQVHQAHLSIQTQRKTPDLTMLFIVEGDALCQKHEAVLHRVGEHKIESLETSVSIAHVPQSSGFEAAQQSFEETKSKFGFRRLLARTQKSLDKPVSNPDVQPLSQVKRRVTFAPQTPVTSLPNGHRTHAQPESHLIPDLCAFLWTRQRPDRGIIFHESDHPFEISRSQQSTSARATNLVPLPDLLDAHHKGSLDIARQDRFTMASHLASALLQTHSSSWLSTRWSKADFCFLVDAETLYSSYPYVSQTFASNTASMTEAIADSPSPPTEEDTRASFFTIGVIILELIFGHNIESCPFRKNYYGVDNKPNDQTDISTARKWATKVLGECGADIADVVRRCLDCSFGPRPSFSDGRFREAVYEGVVKPLAEYTRIWPEISP